MKAETRALIETTLGVLARLSTELRSVLDSESGQVPMPVAIPAAPAPAPAYPRHAFAADLASFLAKRRTWAGPVIGLLSEMYGDKVPVGAYAASRFLSVMASAHQGPISVARGGSVSCGDKGTYMTWAIALRSEER
jgi:hypothetical protein